MTQHFSLNLPQTLCKVLC